MKRDRSTIADGLANQMYTTLEEGTIDDSNLFSTTVQKFVELPRIAPALGFERDTSAQDIWTISRIIGSIKSAFLGILKTIGPRYLGQRAVAQSTASVCFTKDVPQKCVTKVTGIPETLWKQGGCLADRNACAGCAEMESSIPLSEHADRIPWKVIWEWFHSDDCIKVTEDKQTKRRYSKKKFTLPDYRKTTLQLDCVHRVRFCTAQELAISFTESECYKKILQDTGRTSISLPKIMSCICSCIKECKRRECSCPECTGFREKLKAWDEFRTEARRDGETCGCPECAEGTKWRRASESPSAWRSSTTCGKVPFPELINPCEPGVVPRFNQLKCSLLPKKLKRRASEIKRDGGDTYSTVYYPGHVPKCTDCGWETIAPDQCPVEMSNKPCKWMEKISGIGPKGEDVWTEKYGKRSELLESIQRDGPRYNYHMWVHQWTRWQYDLDAETFDGETEIVVVTDFSAVYEMKDNVGEKCTHGTHCNQLVALVLHSPRERPVEGGERPVTMDVWRIWSQKKGNAEFHQMAMKEIARHYKKKIPTLKRMKVKSDGCRSQYKCRKNFGPMAVWPHPTQEEIERGGVEEIPCICGYDATSCGRAMQSGLGIEMFHDFPVSHHGSGPVDSYGKDARRGMDRESKFGRLHRYNFSHCLTWCENHMKRPAQDRKRKGKWSATNYIWRGYSDGLFPGDEYPVVPQDREWQQLSGSNEFYAFRAVHEYRPEIQAQFVPCYCSPHACPHMDITNAHSSTREAEFFTVHELDSHLQREDSDSEY